MKVSTIIATVAIATALVACGGKKTVEPKQDDTPMLQQNRGDMMNRMDRVIEDQDNR